MLVVLQLIVAYVLAECFTASLLHLAHTCTVPFRCEAVADEFIAYCVTFGDNLHLWCQGGAKFVHPCFSKVHV